MLFDIISESNLTASPRWNAEAFLLIRASHTTHSDFDMVTLGSLVTIRKESISPSDFPDKKFNYIGLENISQNSGELVGEIIKGGSEIKSRSKIYRFGDILYGKLRPNLNKCLLVDKNLEGVCSSEIIVLIPDVNLVVPLYLRELLLSKYVSEHVMSMTSGATLPRLNINEFMDLRIPVPPKDMQSMISNRLFDKRKKISMYEEKTKLLKESIHEEFQEFIEKNIVKDKVDA
ncbi:TPA: restriction endonuclease subunit S [Serratia fonticola]